MHVARVWFFSFHVLSWFPHAMVHLSCTKFLPPCPTRTHANRCQHQLPWAKHPRPGWNTNPPLSVRSCPTIQKTRCLMMGQTWICGRLSRNTYFEVDLKREFAKCLSVLAGRFVEVLQFPPVKPCEVRSEMTMRKFRPTEYFLVVFLIT